MSVWFVGVDSYGEGVADVSLLKDCSVLIDCKGL
jgi:hypothetical protein